MRPPDAAPRVVTVREGGRLVGLAPFLVHGGPRGRAALRLFGTPSLPQRAGILAAPGHEAAVWVQVARALGRSQPRPALVSLERVDANAAWPRAVARAWPGAGQARLLREFRIPGQAVTMRAGSWDAWLAGRSHNARRDVRRTAKRIEKRAGVVTRADDTPALDRAIEAFGSLHERRWGDRSRLWHPEALAMLRRRGREPAGVPPPAPLRHRGRGARRRHPPRVRRGRRGDGLERRLGARLEPGAADDGALLPGDRGLLRPRRPAPRLRRGRAALQAAARRPAGPGRLGDHPAAGARLPADAPGDGAAPPARPRAHGAAAPPPDVQARLRRLRAGGASEPVSDEGGEAAP